MIILLCLLIQDNTGFKEGLVVYNWNKVNVDLNNVEAASLQFLNSIKGNSYIPSNFISNVNAMASTNAEKVLSLTSLIKNVKQFDSYIINGIPHGGSNIITKYNQLVSPVIDAANTAINNISNYGITDSNVVSILNEKNYFNSLSQVVQLQFYLKNNPGTIYVAPTPVPAPTQAPIPAPMLTPSTVTSRPVLTPSPVTSRPVTTPSVTTPSTVTSRPVTTSSTILR